MYFSFYLNFIVQWDDEKIIILNTFVGVCLKDNLLRLT